MNAEKKRSRPHILGLTGSIGMGKSTVAAMFRDLGVPVFDADEAVRALQGPGGALVEAIEYAFPGSTGIEGVDRGRLGEQVFGDRLALAQLEAIVHPAVAAAREAFLEAHAQAPLVVLDIPLLFEKGGAELVDSIAVVSAPDNVRVARVLARPGMTRKKFDAIRALQLPDDDKRARADHIIDTGADIETTRVQVAELTACLGGAQAQYG